MKIIHFIKMAGAGNDFIIIQNQAGLGTNLKQLTKRICDRTNGIGADGLLILDKSKKYDYRMRIINADGSEAEMCGNGARCMAAYIVRYFKPKKKTFSIETMAGEILAEAAGETATIRLSDPKDYIETITLEMNGRQIHAGYINTGVPHAVIFVDGLATIDVNTIGHAIRFHKRFEPAGTNVNFVEQVSAGMVAVRTYERGVEAETKACGTGSVASAIITYLKANPDTKAFKKASMRVKTASGEILKVTFDLRGRTVNNVWLNGSARFIAEGKYYF